MSISRITIADLRRMEDQEGLILQGCGGPLQQWVDGVNQMLTENGCLLEGTTFRKVSSFERNGCTCLLFHFTDDVKLDVGKLAAWRLQSYDVFGGTWLSDYVPNRLGGFARDQPEPKQERVKPVCALDKTAGNVRDLVGLASKTLREHGMEEEANQMCYRIHHCHNYDSALSIIGDYVNIADAQPQNEMDEMNMEMR